jgi:hypothetical protein
MDAKKRQVIIYVMFGLAIIWGIYSFKGNTEKALSPPPKPVERIQSPVPRSNSAAIDIEKYSSLEWGRDPFYRPRRAPEARVTSRGKSARSVEPRWILGGILYNERNPSAVINRTIVSGGDDIDGARVVKIDKNEVTLEKGGLLFTLTLAKDQS